VHLDPGSLETATGLGVAVEHHDDTGSDGKHIASERADFVLGDLDKANLEFPQQVVQTRREPSQLYDGKVVGDRRDDRHEVKTLLGPPVVRDVEDSHITVEHTR
jgi:hypothetical protein